MADFIRVDVKNGLDQMLDGLEALEPRNIPFAIAKSLTDTARDVEQFTRANMAKHIDRPTPFTLNSLFTSNATKTNLVAVVKFKDFATKGAAAGRYLQPITEGKARTDKSSERKLKNAGVMRKDQFLTPAQKTRLNGYGNVPASTYVQVLAYLKASGESGFMANRTKQSQQRNGKMRQFFAVQDEGGGSGIYRSLPPGIYQRLQGTGKAVRMIFAFVRQPKYRISFPFYEQAQERTVQVFPEKIKATIEYIAKQPPRGTRR